MAKMALYDEIGPHGSFSGPQCLYTISGPWNGFNSNVSFPFWSASRVRKVSMQCCLLHEQKICAYFFICLRPVNCQEWSGGLPYTRVDT